MKKFLVVAAGLLAVVVLFAVVFLPRLVDPERYRPRVERALREATGWEVSLGTMGLRILGGTALSVRDARLADPPSGFHVEVGELRVGVALLPLLARRLEITGVEILRPDVTLRWTADGLRLPSPPPEPEAGEPPASGGGESGLSVVVERITVRDGTLVLEYTARAAPVRWALTGLGGTLLPRTRELQLAARMGGGSLTLGGTLGTEAVLGLQDIGTADLPPWLLGDLLEPGGTLSGTVRAFPGGESLRLAAELEASGLMLAGGEAPLDGVSARMEMVRTGGGITLRDLEIRAAGATLTGGGRVAPRLALALTLGPSPAGSALRLARAARPVPLSVEEPGTLRAAVTVRGGSGSPVTIGAEGTLSAAGVTLLAGLPAVRDARVTFSLDPSGGLSATLAGGTFAGGNVTGTVGLAPVSPPGTLGVDARLRDAHVAELLRSVGSTQADRITGRASGAVRLTADLSRGLPGPGDLRGSLDATLADLTLPGWDLLSAVTAQLGKGGSWKEMLQAVAGTQQETAAGPATFREARLEATLAGIPWTVRRLDLDGGDLTAAGSGTFDPVTGTVDLRLEARLGPDQSRRIVRNASFLASLQDDRGRLVVPVTVGGPLTAPAISVDLREVLTGDGKGGGGLVGGLLDSLLGGGKR